MTVKQATTQQLLLDNVSADTNATIPRQQADTTIMGSGIFYSVRAEML
jgi:hypothetical protein